MTTVLQRIKDKRLTHAQECESRVVFELAAEGSETMTVKQLKRCLRALGFNIAKGEVQALVYEFDYTDTNTINVVDFQKIFLSKVLESSERDKFNQAFRVMAGDSSDKISVCDLSSVLHATEFAQSVENNEGDMQVYEKIDGNALRQQIGLQYYNDQESEAVHEFLDNSAELHVPKAALAAFLRV